MSDQAQGPGWWLASDGKWYPPEMASTQPQAAGAQSLASPQSDQTQVTPPPYSEGKLPDKLTTPEPHPEVPLLQKRWFRVVALLAAGFLGGLVAGAGAFSSEEETLKASNAELSAELAATTKKLNDRDSQTRSDEAAAKKAEADQAAAAKKTADNQAKAAKKSADEQAAVAKKAADDQAAADKKAAEDFRAAVKKASDEQAAADKRAAEEQAAAQAAAAAKSKIPGSGTFAIGSDKTPGTYQTPGPERGFSSCYYAVLSSPTASGIDNIIDNNNISGQGIVSLKAGQYLETSRCQDWTKN